MAIGANAAPSGWLRQRLPLLWLGVAVFFLHFLVTGGHVLSPDEELLFRIAESIATEGNTSVLPLEADLRWGLVPQEIQNTFATRPGRAPGTYYAQYLVLQPLLAVPLVWLGQGLEGALAGGFAAALPDTMALSSLETLPPEEFAPAAFRRGMVVMFFNPLVAAFSAIVLARLGRLLTGSRGAGIAAGGLWAFGTMAWPHSRSFFTEPLAGLLALLAVEQLIRWHSKPLDGGLRHAILAGIFLGLANWVRVDSPFFTVGLGLAALILAAQRSQQATESVWRGLPWFPLFIAGAIPLGAWIGLQTFNTLRFGGSDLTAGYGDQTEGVKFTTPILIGAHGLLLAPGKGLFYFSPALLLGLWGWMKLPSGLCHVRTIVFLGYLPFTLAMMTWQNWSGGWDWGPRHLVQIHLPIMLGAAFLWNGGLPGVQAFLAGLIAAAAAAVQIYGSSQNPLDFYREYYVTVDDGVYISVNLTPLQEGAIVQEYWFGRRDEDGMPGETLRPNRFPAPMIDSTYLPQHTQWVKYREMWELGYCDWYFWNLIVRGGDTTNWKDRL